MRQRVIYGTTIFVGFLTIVMCFVLINYPDLHVMAQQKELEIRAKFQEEYSILDLIREETEIVIAAEDTNQMQGQLRLELPIGTAFSDLTIEEKPISQTIEICIPGVDNDYFYDYPMVGLSDHIEDITFENEAGDGYIEIVLDNVYALDVVCEENYVYLSFVDPHEIYDYIVVVDAGHGGTDAGATKQGITEKEINLAIVEAFKKIADADEEANIGIYYTRLDGTNPSLESRVALANMLDADLFLSVHNNSTSSGRMSSINGTSVMYHVEDDTGLSKRFAEICLDNLLDALSSNSKGVIAGDTIYIVRTAEMPVALVEIGFMTNQEELDKLNSEEYQELAAQALYDSVKQALEEFSEE